ncbi:MAG: magnesium chelatase subunit D [Nannocystaceae bacterium]
MSAAVLDDATTEPTLDGWDDVVMALRLLAVDPLGLGGIVLRGRSGPVRDRVTGWIRELAAPGTPFARIPLHISEDRLLGGIALAETLSRGSLVREQGLLARCDGGVAVVAMAERAEPHVVSHLCSVLDRGELALERESISARIPCRLSLLVLDEGIGDEAIAPALRDRLTFEVRLDELDPRRAPELAPERVGAARARMDAVEIGDEAIDALCRAAWSLGIPSLRAVVLAGTAARAHAALEGRDHVEETDLGVAARLVLGPLATRIEQPTEIPPEEQEPAANDPMEDEPTEDPPRDPPEPEASEGPDEEPEPTEDFEDDRIDPAALQELVLEAAKSGVPGGLLETLRIDSGSRRAPRSAGQTGASKYSVLTGRPVGATAAAPRHGSRLHILETLRAAAPWQRLRSGERPRSSRARLDVRKEDFRTRRFKQRTESCVIFAVDASGSAALRRLAEAKGAVERVLADCYVRRDHVALIVFRGTQATVVLPPTRSLARVRRRLADLAGGGPTPLASGIDAALALANDCRERGQTPMLVLMTDGKGNVARNGDKGSAAAKQDAIDSSRRVRASGVPTLLIDTGPRTQRRVRELAAELDARYVHLPYLDDVGVSREVKSMAQESACR